jgi:hypothetical protein
VSLVCAARREDFYIEAGVRSRGAVTHSISGRKLHEYLMKLISDLLRTGEAFRKRHMVEIFAIFRVCMGYDVHDNYDKVPL